MIVNPSVSGGGSKIQYYNIKAQDVQFNKSGRTCTVTITLPSLIKTLLGLGVCIWDGSTSSFSISYPGCDLTGSDDLTAAFLHTSTTDGGTFAVSTISYSGNNITLERRNMWDNDPEFFLGACMYVPG